MGTFAPIDLGISSMEAFRLRSCGSKVPHPTRRAAKHAARAAATHGLGRMHAYACRFCGRWHVGHPMRRDRLDALAS